MALGVIPRIAGAGVRLEQRPRVLRARGASARHGQQLALDLGDLQIELAHPVGIAGPNGSGKTTFATLLSGLRAPTSGSLQLDGVTATDVSRDDIAFVPQDPVLVESLSIADNLRLVAAECDLGDAAKLLKALGLEAPLDKPAGSLSRGEQRRIAIARALLKKPKLLVLDEPDAWLDVEGRRCLLQTLRSVSEETSIIVVSHRPDVLLQFQTVVVLSEQHDVEAVAHPDQLRLASPAFRALLGAELHEAQPTEARH